MSLEQDDFNRLYKLVVDHGIDTTIDAEQFEISRRLVQQLAKQYSERGNIPTIETPGPSAHADHPDYTETQALAVYEMIGWGAVALAHKLRVQNSFSIDNNRVHDIPTKS